MRKLLIAAVMVSQALIGQTTTTSAPSTASIQGTVTDWSTSKPIVGAIVKANNPSSSWFGLSAQTGADGVYQIRNAPAGTLFLCAWVPYQPYLDPCFGGAAGPPITVTLTNGQQSTGNQIALKQDPRLAGLVTVPTPGTGVIRGTVFDVTNNNPIAGAIVTAASTAPAAFSQSVTTAADGSYQINNVPAGSFALCAHVPGDRYLNSCQWGKTPLMLTLTNGQQNTGNRLNITVGSTLKVHIQDPSQLLKEQTKDGNAPDLALGVFGPQALFYPAHQIGKDSGGADYQLAIPFDTRVTFSIASKSLTLADSLGTALPNNAVQKTLQLSAGDSGAEQFTYTVTGKHQ